MKAIDLEGLLERYVFCEVESDQLRTLITMILENATLSWDEKRLCVDSEIIIMNYVKTIAPNDYERRFRALKKEKEEKKNNED